MADATLITIAEDVKDLLNDHTFSQEFTAERRYMPTADLKDLETLKVWVVPKAKEITPASRTSNEVLYSVDVAFQKQARGVSECDPLMALAEEVAEYLDRLALPTVTDAIWVGTANAPIWDPADLHERAVFTTVVTVTYRASR